MEAGSTELKMRVLWSITNGHSTTPYYPSLYELNLMYTGNLHALYYHCKNHSATANLQKETPACHVSSASTLSCRGTSSSGW